MVGDVIIIVHVVLDSIDHIVDDVIDDGDNIEYVSDKRNFAWPIVSYKGLYKQTYKYSPIPRCPIIASRSGKDSSLSPLINFFIHV